MYCIYGDLFMYVGLFQCFGVYLATETLSLLLLFPYTHTRTHIWMYVCMSMCSNVWLSVQLNALIIQTTITLAVINT